MRFVTITAFLSTGKVKPICLPYTAALQKPIPDKLDVVYKHQAELNSDKAPMIQTVSTHSLSECSQFFKRTINAESGYLCAGKFYIAALKKSSLLCNFFDF